MADERTVSIELDDGTKLVVVAEQVGPTLVSDEDLIGKLSGVTKSIEQVGKDVLAAVKRVGPSKATVEMGFGLAIEAGGLVALFGKGKGEASITVTLEWSSTD